MLCHWVTFCLLIVDAGSDKFGVGMDTWSWLKWVTSNVSNGFLVVSSSEWWRGAKDGFNIPSTNTDTLEVSVSVTIRGIVLSLWKRRIVNSHHDEAVKYLKIMLIVSFCPQLVYPRQRLPVFTSVNTVVDSIALGPADGASFCLLPELLALHIRIVLLLPSRRLFCSSTSFRSYCRLYYTSSFSLHTCQINSPVSSFNYRVLELNTRRNTEGTRQSTLQRGLDLQWLTASSTKSPSQRCARQVNHLQGTTVSDYLVEGLI